MELQTVKQFLTVGQTLAWRHTGIKEQNWPWKRGVESIESGLFKATLKPQLQ
jgi:hypothetical protein